MFKQNEKSIAQIAEYIPRACRGMQLQEAKARLEKKLRSISMTAVMLPFLTRRSRQLLTVIRESLFFVHRSADPQRRQPVSEINYRELREIAKKATQGEWVAFISPGKYGTYAVHTPGDNHHGDIVDWPGFDEQKNAENNARYIAAFNPEVVQALLDERERNQQYIKSRDPRRTRILLLLLGSCALSWKAKTAK